MPPKSLLPLFAFLILAPAASFVFAAPPDPDFGPNVLIFDQSMPAIQKQIDAVFTKQESAQFGPGRFAYLFKPGKYDLDVQVGFYTQVLGLGRSPDDVAITGAVRSTAGWMHGNATCNFWRSVENLSVTPTRDRNTDVWAVSQATALRRVHIKGNLSLFDGGWSSGGFIADCKIDGEVQSGSQQQWFSRNSDWATWRGGVWNMVFVGTNNPPTGSWPDKPYTVIDQTPLVREKPYLTIDQTSHYFVMAPRFNSSPTRGISWSAGDTNTKAIPIEQFFIARADRDNAASINAALDVGKNLLFTPGIYHLETSLHISQPGTIILGLGYPTLVPDHATPAITISDVDGVEVASLILEAGPSESPTLLEVGPPDSKVSHAADPVSLYDIATRAGGAVAGTTDCFVTINSNNVLAENFWLWRADHGAGAGWNSNKNRNGLIVNGNDVTFYGLFVEHCQQYQTLWNGNGGRVYFYQSEMPYDPPSQQAWSHDGVRGYASYKVADNVMTHQAWGLGVYCVFNDAPVIADSAIETPDVPGVQMHHMITLRLNGKPGSGIAHVINNRGDPIITSQKSQVP